MSNSLLSIIVINYRTPRETVLCINNLRESSSENTQIIVVDNASGDDSLEVFQRELVHARVVASPTNTGFAGGCKIGVEHAEGTYLAFINSDCYASPGSMSKLVEYLESHAEAACVVPRLLESDGRVQANVALLPTAKTIIDEYLFGRNSGWYRDLSVWQNPTPVEGFSGAALVIRKSAYEAAGGFTTHYFMYVEDTELSWNLRLQGLKVVYIPTAVMTHASGGSSHSSRKRLNSMLQKNRRDFVWRHFPRGSALGTISIMYLGLGILSLKHEIKSLTHRGNLS